MSARSWTLAILCLAAFALGGCGKGVGDYQVSSDFQPFIATFSSAAGDHGKPVEIHSLVVEFGDTGTAAGKCFKDFLDTPKIVVRKDVWDQVSEAGREILIYHELGHCILNRQHDSEVVHDDAWGDYPKSIMNPVMIDEEIYQEKRDYYLQELFQDAS